MKKGIIVTMLSKYSHVFIQILISAVMARYLSPKEFGTVAMIMVFITFFYFLSDMGIGPSIVQNKELTDEDIGSIFNLSLIIGIVLTMLFIGTSYFIGLFFKNGILVLLAQLMSVSIFFSTVSIVPKALLEKQKKFGLIGIFVFISVVVSGGTAIFMAVKGYSFYALIAQSNINAIILFILMFIYSGLKLNKKLSMDSIKKIGRNSMYQLSFNIVNYFTRNFDNIMIGKILGTSQLGIYDRAYKLMLYPITFLPHTIQPVLNAHFSDYQNDKSKIYRNYKKVLLLLGCLSMPISAFLFFSSKEVILIMYGNNWVESIPVFKILALSVATQILSSSTGAIYQATGRTDLLFKTGVFNSISSIILIWISVPFGLSVLAYAIVIAFLINFITSFIGLVKYVFSEEIMEFFKDILIPLILLGGFSFGAFYLGIKFIRIDNMFLSILIKGVIFMALVVFGIKTIFLKYK